MKCFAGNLARIGCRLYFVSSAVFFGACQNLDGSKVGGADSTASMPAPKTVEDFRLLDQNGRAHRLFELKDKKLIIMIGHKIGCPILEKSYQKIKEIQKKYENLGVEIFFLNAGLEDSPQDLQEDLKNFNQPIPILRDRAQLIARSLGLARSAQAVVITPTNWQIVYSGPIDDEFDYGGDKTTNVNQFLTDAIESLLNGSKPKILLREAKGCLVSSAGPEPSFKDFAEVFQKKCLSCHQEGRFRPNNMSSYQKIRGWGPMIREVIRTGRMPPWMPDSEVIRYKDDWSLTPEEAHTLVGWIEAGMPFGPKKDSPDLKAPVPEPTNAPPADWVLPVDKEDVLPANGPVRYRNYFLGQTNVDHLISAIEAVDRVKNGVTHHFTLMVAPKRLRDAEIEEMMIPEVNQYFIRPSIRQAFPKNTALLIPKGSFLYLRGHYEVNGKIEKTQPELRLWHYGGSSSLKKKAPALLDIARLSVVDIKIPPHQQLKVEAAEVLKNEVWAYAVSVHMHKRGASAKITAHLPDGRVIPLLSFPSFNYRMNEHFELAEPLLLPAQTKLVAEGVFDNSEKNSLNPDPSAEVVFGPALDNEMFHARVFYYNADHGKGKLKQAQPAKN
jgi:peroxiredoxin